MISPIEVIAEIIRRTLYQMRHNVQFIDREGICTL
jgi:hypothetical protein